MKTKAPLSTASLTLRIGGDDRTMRSPGLPCRMSHRWLIRSDRQMQPVTAEELAVIGCGPERARRR